MQRGLVILDFMAYPARVCRGMANRGYVQLLTKCKAAASTNPTNQIRDSLISIRNQSSMLLNCHRNNRCFGTWTADRLGQGTEHEMETKTASSLESTDSTQSSPDNPASEMELSQLSESELRHIQNVAAAIPHGVFSVYFLQIEISRN